MNRYRNFIRIAGRDFNMDFIESIEVCEAINPEYAVVNIEYKDKSITYPITGTAKENQEKLDEAYWVLHRSPSLSLIKTGIERR